MLPLWPCNLQQFWPPAVTGIVAASWPCARAMWEGAGRPVRGTVSKLNPYRHDRQMKILGPHCRSQGLQWLTEMQHHQSRPLGYKDQAFCRHYISTGCWLGCGVAQQGPDSGPLRVPLHNFALCGGAGSLRFLGCFQT